MRDEAREWNAESYQRVSDPQVAWGERVLNRLPLRGDETVADLGCGTGRLTERLLERLPQGHVIAVDRSEAMVREAQARLALCSRGRVKFLLQDLLELELGDDVDAIFSTATFHWITDHDRLFRRLHDTLAPGGLLVAQCGGKGNLHRLLQRVDLLLQSPPYAQYYHDWSSPWEFADPNTTTERLKRAGFVEVETGLEEAPTELSDANAYREFVATVILRTHLMRLPSDDLRSHLLNRLTKEAAGDQPRFSLDYQRLNLQARRPALS